MTRIIIVVYALEGSPKIGYAKRTLDNVLATTDLTKHQLFISDNGSCLEMEDYYCEISKGQPNIDVRLNGENLGTARAFNKGLIGLPEGWFAIKRDDDTIVHDHEWVEKMEKVAEKDPIYGITGLKRPDLIQHPDNPKDFYPSTIRMLPHVKGERYFVVEETEDIIGTCTMFSPELLKKVGGLSQPKVYAWDDVLMSLRSRLAGFKNCFLIGVDIDHIDEGGDQFTQWKNTEATDVIDQFHEMCDDYKSGVRDLYEPIEEN